MTFASKLAKLGKADIVNLSQISAEPVTFYVYLSNNKIELKQLEYSNNKYTLSKAVNSFNYTEMLALNASFVVARIGSNFSIIKV